MQVEYADDNLRRLAIDPEFRGRFPAEVVTAYWKVLNFIKRSTDERDLRAWKSLHFEKLTADLEGLHSLRLNRQWRLIIEIAGQAPNKTVVVRDVQNYHEG